MKKILTALFACSFLLAGCNYQEGATFLGEVGNNFVVVEQSLDPRNIDELKAYKLTNTKSFSENINTFLNDNVIVKSGAYDTLVKYEALFTNRLDASVADLRNNILKQIFEFNKETASREELISFYINAYNFLAIDIVVSFFEDVNGNRLASISDIFGKGSFKAFDDVKYYIAGELTSLNELEKRDLKSVLTRSNGRVDSRFHFAVICAAKGCPILMHEAYVPERLEEQLDFITKKGLELSRNFDNSGSKTKLTQLFNWYKSDFVSHEASDGEQISSIDGFIGKYLEQVININEIEYIHYDWALNSAENK